MSDPRRVPVPVDAVTQGWSQAAKDELEAARCTPRHDCDVMCASTPPAGRPASHLGRRREW